MIAEILPSAVVAVESRGALRLPDGPHPSGGPPSPYGIPSSGGPCPPSVPGPPDTLSGAERAAIATADPGRRAEFAAGRACAHAALAELGARPGPVLSAWSGPVLPGPAGEPRWPPGVVGSLTHCAGYRACAVARAQDVAAIGIDAEPARALPPGLIQVVAVGPERRRLADLGPADPRLPWDLLLFCAKEAVYKAWFPLTGQRLAFADVLVELAVTGGFAARVAGGNGEPGGRAGTLAGRWLVRDGLALTAVAVAARSPSAGDWSG